MPLMKKLAIALLLLTGFAAAPGAALAGDVKFQASIDRPTISMDDSVALKLTITAEGMANVDSVNFSAPDFDVVNEFQNTYIQSVYENGHFSVKNNQLVTKVLRPHKEGTFQITGISAQVDGKTYTAPPISVRVVAGGAGTPPPPNSAVGAGPGPGLSGAGSNPTGKVFFLRAEVDKDKAYKGEQIIVSYYLYRRVRVFNPQVDKFPVLKGFLREDLEMPVLSPRLDSERAVLGGVPYERTLLLRYAAYPLQEGKLTIDSLDMKLNYFHTSPDDDDDPFNQFFQQFAAKIATLHSEPLTIEAMPLPEEGRPDSFTGGVGNFNVTSAIDRYDVHANDAATLTVKVEGRGNVAAIGEPKVKWPENVELYDSKSQSTSGKSGDGQKVFTFLLIPRVPGKVTIPPVEFSFFDPAQKKYVTQKTEPIDLNVLAPAPGSVAAQPQQPKAMANGSAPAAPTAQSPQDQLRPLKPPRARMGLGTPFLMRPTLYWLGLLGFLALFALVAKDMVQKRSALAAATAGTRQRSAEKSWDRIEKEAGAAAQASWQEVVQAYERVAGALFDALDRRYAVGARALSRKELKSILVDERGLSESVWLRVSRLLEFAETVRFASSAGAVSEQEARTQLSRWVAEGKTLDKMLSESRP